MNQRCFDAGMAAGGLEEALHCGSVHVAYPYVETPLFVSQNM